MYSFLSGIWALILPIYLYSYLDTENQESLCSNNIGSNSLLEVFIYTHFCYYTEFKWTSFAGSWTFCPAINMYSPLSNCLFIMNRRSYTQFRLFSLLTVVITWQEFLIFLCMWVFLPSLHTHYLLREVFNRGAIH